MPGGGRLVGGAFATCGGGGGAGFGTGGGGGGGGGAAATFGGLGGLHISSLPLRSCSRAASWILSFFSSAWMSSSDAFSTGVGSGGASGAGGAGVSSVATLSDGSTGAQARNSHEVISSRSSSISPNSRPLSQRDQPRRAGNSAAGALARIAAGGVAAGTSVDTGAGSGGDAKPCRPAAASA